MFIRLLCSATLDMYAFMCVCTVRMDVCIYVHTYVRMYVYMYV